MDSRLNESNTTNCQPPLTPNVVVLSYDTPMEVPTQKLSDKNQKMLVYRRMLQFQAGVVAEQGLSTSEAALLRAHKHKAIQDVKLSQSKDPVGWIQPLMLRHFQSTCAASGVFYSLPLDILKRGLARIGKRCMCSILCA